MPQDRDDKFSASIVSAIERTLAEASLATLATIVEGRSNSGAKVLITEEGNWVGTLGDDLLDNAVALHSREFLGSLEEARQYNAAEIAPQLTAWRDSKILLERIEPEPRIVVCGAGHVGASLTNLARLVGYAVTLIDDRKEFLTREKFPDPGIDLVLAEEWSEAVGRAVGRGRGIYIAVVTRGHNEDEKCIGAVMSTRVDYVGVIGSRRRTNFVLDRLRQKGIAEDRLNEVNAPIGLDIGAVSSQEVALAILAEIVSQRRGGTGRPLSSWRRAKTGGMGRKHRT